jgi:hypothetical protein
LNFVFPETPRGEVVIYRGVELLESALESYRDNVGRLIAWSMFASFTHRREEAEEYGRAWRGGIPILLELRSAWCPRPANGTYLLHPFAVLRVEAVLGNTVKLVEVEPALVRSMDARCRGVPSQFGWIELHEAAECGDVRSTLRLVTGPESWERREARGWTLLHRVAFNGSGEVMKALASRGADVNVPMFDGTTPLHIATLHCRLGMVKTLATLGADVDVRSTRACLHVLSPHA